MLYDTVTGIQASPWETQSCGELEREAWTRLFSSASRWMRRSASFWNNVRGGSVGVRGRLTFFALRMVDSSVSRVASERSVICASSQPPFGPRGQWMDSRSSQRPGGTSARPAPSRA